MYLLTGRMTFFSLATTHGRKFLCLIVYIEKLQGVLLVYACQEIKYYCMSHGHNLQRMSIKVNPYSIRVCIGNRDLSLLIIDLVKPGIILCHSTLFISKCYMPSLKFCACENY